MRRLTGSGAIITQLMGAAVAIFHLYTSFAGVYPPYLHRGVHLLFLLPLGFLLYPATEKSPKDRITWLDALLAILSVLPSLYVIINRRYLDVRLINIAPVYGIEIILGLILVVLVIEAVRRAVAPVMAVLVLIFFLYLPFGHLLPGLFYHREYPIERIIESVFLLSSDGVYGPLTGTSATQVVLFILFGSFVVKMGAGEFFTNFARAVAGASRGGPAKIATLSSMLFGTLTGSSVANVYATGTFTIPLMKRYGFSNNFAGAVEAAASTGGQLMPPIMGAAAFIMAENLGIPYIKIALYAVIPAVLYYVSIWMMIDARCQRDGIVGESKENLPSLKETMKGAHTFIPVVILFTLLCSGFSVLFSGFYSIVACVIVSFFRKDSRMTPKRIFDALFDGAHSAAMVAIALAGAGIIVVGLTKTGLALTIGSMIVSLAYGHLILALLFIAIVTIILGMGVPTTPSYVIAAAVGSTALLQMGVMPIAAHLFVFYFAVISNITPPVAIAAYAGASVAKGDPMKTGVEAFLLASSGYIIPFLFVFSPVLILQGQPLDVAIACLTALLGIYLLSGGLQGWFFGKASIPVRLILVAGALSLIHPGLLTDAIGLGVGICMYFLQKLVAKKRGEQHA